MSSGERSELFVQAYPPSNVAATQPAIINFFIGLLVKDKIRNQFRLRNEYVGIAKNVADLIEN